MPYRAIGYAVVVAVIFGSGWQVRAWFEGAKDAARLEAENKARAELREFGNTLAAKTEKAIGEIRIENKTIYTTTAKEIIREPIYADCPLPESGRLRANQARGGAAAGQSPDAVRAAQPIAR